MLHRRHLLTKAAKTLILGIAVSPAWAPLRMEASAAPTNKRLTIGISQEFDSLNPIVSTMSAAMYILAMTNRSLVTIDADWKWHCSTCTEIPSLENGKAKLIDENGKKKMLVTWEIKPEVKWADGTPMTGKDVKLSWEIGRNPNIAVGDKELFNRIESIDIDSKNPKKFKIKYSEPRYDFYQLVGLNIVPAHLEGEIFAKTKSEAGAYEKLTLYTAAPTTIGLFNGPYIIKEVKLGSHVMLERNPQFWGPQPAIESIVVKLIPNTQTMEANLLSGTIDLISELGISLDQSLAFEKRLKSNPAQAQLFKVMIEDSMTYEHIDFDLDNPFLSDVRVRKAIAYGIDRDKLIKGLFEGKRKKASSHVHPKDVYFTEDLTVYNFDQAKASQLLEEAGFKKGSSGYLEKDGKRLTLPLMTTAQNKTREMVEVYIQEQLKKLGIEVTINNQPARVFFGETTHKRKFGGMAMFAWTSSPDSPPRSILHSDQIPTEKNAWNGQNVPGWRNPRNDQILDSIFREFDVHKRKAMMVEQQKLYTEDLPVLPICMLADIAVIPTNLTGFRLTGHQFPSTMTVENWKLN